MKQTTAMCEQSPESCWGTPPWLIAYAHELLGGYIDLDPCTTPENRVGARRYIAPPDDGILQSWTGARSIYCNPPYGRTMPHWVRKCIDASSAARVLLLVPGRSDNAWYHDALKNCTEALLLRKRIAFTDPLTGLPRKGGGKFASVLFAFGFTFGETALGVIITARNAA